MQVVPVASMASNSDVGILFCKSWNLEDTIIRVYYLRAYSGVFRKTTEVKRIFYWHMQLIQDLLLRCNIMSTGS